MQISLGQLTFILSVLGVSLSVLVFFKKQYIPADYAETKKDVEILKKQMELFWGVIEKEMSRLLHSPHRPVLDAFLDKNLGDETLSKDEAVELVDLLQRLINTGELSSDEVGYATMLMATTVAKYKLEEYVS